MEDPLKRGCIAFGGVSIAVILISLVMEANGSAFASNPAWQLILCLRNGFLWLWVLLLTMTVSLFLIVYVSSWLEELKQRKHQREEALRERPIQIANRQKYAAQALKEKERKEQAEAQAKIEEQERQEKFQREIERRRSRSAKSATDEAMDSFG